jgi:predicted PhzF superfamily epimerase YddE/YHI9
MVLGGHAAIATGVSLGETEGDDTYILKKAVGKVPVFRSHPEWIV